MLNAEKQEPMILQSSSRISRPDMLSRWRKADFYHHDHQCTDEDFQVPNSLQSQNIIEFFKASTQSSRASGCITKLNNTSVKITSHFDGPNIAIHRIRLCLLSHKASRICLSKTCRFIVWQVRQRHHANYLELTGRCTCWVALLSSSFSTTVVFYFRMRTANTQSPSKRVSTQPYAWASWNCRLRKGFNERCPVAYPKLEYTSRQDLSGKKTSIAQIQEHFTQLSGPIKEPM